MDLVIDLISFVEGKSYGFQEYILNLLDDFSSLRKEIRVEKIILLINQTQHSFFSKKYGDVFQYNCCGFDSTVSMIINEGRFINKMKLSSSDIILFPSNTMPFVRTRAKKILVIHDLLFRHGSYLSKTLYYFLFRFQRYIFIPYSIAKADKIIAISKFTQEEIIEAYHTDPSKIVAIYNYFNFGKYDSDTPSVLSAVNGKYILAVCASYKHKNHITILKAFEQFCKYDNSFSLVFVGDLSLEASSYFHKMDTCIKEKVFFKKHLSNADMKILFVNASMFVSASLYEGLGMPVVEALYFGLPVIISDIKIHREVSLNMAEYFPPTSSQCLCDLMIKNANLRRTKNISNDKIVSIYDKENTSMRYIQLINSMI